MNRFAGCVCAVVALSFATAWGQDWPQWRGPNRDGVAAGSAALADSWPADGPKKLWESEEKILTQQNNGGFGSVSIVGDRAYLYSYVMAPVALTTRTLKPDVLARYAKAKDAPAKEILDKLETIKDKEFPSPEALDKWLADNAIPDDVKARLLKEIPAKGTAASDVFYCLDAATGKTVWKKEFPGQKVHGNGCSSTVCVADGRLYATGGNTNMYCLSAKDGNLVWKSQVPREAPSWAGSSSPLVSDGLAILVAGQLTAYRVSDGNMAWTQPTLKGLAPSPVLWTHEGKKYVVCGSDKEMACVEIATGRILWSVPGGGSSTPVVSGDVAVQVTEGPLGTVAYKMTPQKAEKLWNLPPGDRGTSAVIYKDFVYFIGGWKGYKAWCAGLADGKVAWEQQADEFKNIEINTPILCDGKILLFCGGSTYNLLMLRASSEKCELMAKAKVETSKSPTCNCTNPSIVDGKMFLRLNERVVCYDLKK